MPNHTNVTLLATITECIRPGTTIIPNLWASYLEFQDLTVTDSQNFVDSTTGAHIQTIESLWASVKRKNCRV